MILHWLSKMMLLSVLELQIKKLHCKCTQNTQGIAKATYDKHLHNKYCFQNKLKATEKWLASSRLQLVFTKEHSLKDKVAKQH